jgi:hypothetical protein
MREKVAPGELAGAYEKLDRANELLDDLDRRIAAIMATPPYEIESTYLKKLGGREFRVRVLEGLPTRLGVVFAEAAVQMRSALDYLATGLARREGRPERGGFPIHRSSDGFESWQRKNRMSDTAETLARLRLAQPFQDSEPDEHPLALLQWLTNIDKHVELHASWVRPHEIAGEYEFPEGTSGVELLVPEIRGLGDDDVLFVVRPSPPGDVQARLRVVLDIGFGEKLLTRDDLRMIGRHVLALLAAFHRSWNLVSWQPPDDWLSSRRDRGWKVGGVMSGIDFEGRPISQQVVDNLTQAKLT